MVAIVPNSSSGAISVLNSLRLDFWSVEPEGQGASNPSREGPQHVPLHRNGQIAGRPRIRAMIECQNVRNMSKNVPNRPPHKHDFWTFSGLPKLA